MHRTISPEIDRRWRASRKEEADGGGLTLPPVSPKFHSECCMCGDKGLPFELFRCKSCLFRSQHRYCSNLYPKAESYRQCNWCLRDQKDDDNSSHSSSSLLLPSPPHRAAGSDGDEIITKEIKKNEKEKLPRSISPLPHHPQNLPIWSNKKGGGSSPKGVMRKGPLMAAEKSPPLKTAGAASLRRSASDVGIVKHVVVRNKVRRRYKLLEEVASR
ncbi:unnamed protein product [Cuscuta epithymum]|uniref:PHD-type zinc finger plants domain-containing protein n=1 Tax=Cuscuta epithymum TaxID=186058 RepID=A0AAV0C6T4_9ASTE|nr:unnamed protein product [Cuscuta epithymum]CAH9129901.1 unnamed protein product [Cuscuta epithymum]